ncbi:MAG: glycoside hydrolase family 88 protein [Myxococcales bacterium]
MSSVLRRWRSSSLRYATPALTLAFGCGELARESKPPIAPPASSHAETPASAQPAPAVTPAPKPSAPPLAALSIEVKNPLDAARNAESISLNLAEVRKSLPSLQVAKVVIRSGNGESVLSQLVDTDGDTKPDELVFQTDLKPNESKRFSLSEGTRSAPSRDQFKVYGRFVRERHDDFAWENDRVAHRVYGAALETWALEPLTSSGVDLWVKRTPRLVIDDWYRLDDYHHDNGDGGDFYSVGASRGCGGLGVWDGKALRVSRNFSASRVLANGPIRLVFELDYPAWDVGAGVQVSETKRIVADAGQHFDHFQSAFKVTGKSGGLVLGIGIAKHDKGAIEIDPQAAILRSWEPFAGENGHAGCAVIGGTGAVAGVAETENDRLLLVSLPSTANMSYLAGTGWDKGADVPNDSAWAALVAQTARASRNPPQVSLTMAVAGPRQGAALAWAERVAATLIEQHPQGLMDKWEYDSGVVLKGLLALSKKTGNARYFEYVERSIDRLLDDDGTIKGYRVDEHNLDMLNVGKVLFPLLAAAKEEKERARYRHALDTLRDQLRQQPRTRDGAFWHKQIYPHQIWLDGIYMASPFLTEYALTFGEPAALNDVATQILVAEQHLRDPKTGLLYHGWDETHGERWSNPKTGTSSQFWGRSVGWYAMAVVDVLELLPANHPRRAALLAVLQRLSRAVVAVQDRETGVWWQVLDAAKRDKNYRESSASAMFVYALGKAVRLGFIDRAQFEPAVQRGSRGLLEQFASFDDHERLHVKNICKVAGLGGTPYRDGSYAYYTSTEISDSDPKGVGAFLLAAVETQ